MGLKSPRPALHTCGAALVLVGLALLGGPSGQSHSAAAQGATSQQFPTGVVFEIGDTMWKEWQTSEGKVYYHNSKTGSTQWEDPRKFGTVTTSLKGRQVQELDEEDMLSRSIVVAVPLLLIMGIAAARVGYLHMYYPELLFPTKERKQRKRNRNQMKQMRSRFKVSQDGKGGRSANS